MGGHRRRHARTGVNVANPPEQPAARSYRWGDRVKPESPAARADVKVRDRLIAVNGYRVAEVGPEAVGGLVSLGRGLARYELELDRSG